MNLDHLHTDILFDDGFLLNSLTRLVYRDSQKGWYGCLLNYGSVYPNKAFPIQCDINPRPFL